MLKRLRTILVRVFLWFIGLSVLSVILFRFIPVPVTPLMLIRCGEQLADGKSLRLKKDWTSIDKMSSAMPLAVIAAEDQKFEEHFGFDFEAIQKARKYNERQEAKKGKNKKLKGASTISQQTAKNVFLWPSRSWIRKGFEVYFTFLIEVFWSKKRILEVYLNVIELGDGVYGVEAASRYHFKKSSTKLSNYEAALLAAVLPNPRKWNAGSPGAYIRQKAGRIVFHMGRMKLDYL